MKICKNCKTKTSDLTKYCTNCGGTEFECVDEIKTTQYYEPPTVNNENSNVYESPLSSATNSFESQNKEKVNGWLVVLSIIIPIAGIILYFVRKKEKPKEAKACGIAGLVMIILNFLFTIILSFGATYSTISNYDTAESENDFYSYEYNDEDIESTTATPAETTSSNTNSAQNNSEDFRDYEVVINGAKITLPCTYSDFSKATGFQFESADDGKQTLKSNYTTTENVVCGENNIVCSFLNDSGEMKTLSECYIAGISVYDGSCDSSVIFANNLTVGTKITVDELTNLFGTPDDVYVGEGYSSVSYDDDSAIYNGFDIDIDEGVISYISIDNYNID